MNKVALLAGVCVMAGTTHADVTFRYLPGAIGTMSSDARVFVMDYSLYRDFVEVPLPPTPGFQTPPLPGLLSHDGNVLMTYKRVSQFETLYYIYEGDPPVITQANFYESAPNDECGDIPLDLRSWMLDGDGRYLISDRSYVGDNQCGYVASGGRRRAIEWDRATGTSTFLFLPTDVPGVTPGIAASKMSISAAGISSDGSTVVGSIAPNGATWIRSLSGSAASVCHSRSRTGFEIER